MDGEISEHWSASKRERLYELLYEYPNVGDKRDGQDVTTCCLPLNHRAPSHPKVPVYPSTMLVYKETTHIPSQDFDRTDRQA
jgi:hypothetical protein